MLFHIFLLLTLSMALVAETTSQPKLSSSITEFIIGTTGKTRLISDHPKLLKCSFQNATISFFYISIVQCVFEVFKRYNQYSFFFTSVLCSVFAKVSFPFVVLQCLRRVTIYSKLGLD